MTPGISRRRFLSVSAALAILPSSALAEAPKVRWQGTALGAEASMSLLGMDQTRAHEIFASVEAEVGRLEKIFSLYRQDSLLVSLNRTGRLEGPPPELLELMSLSDALYRSTDGAFDPTVQPLWQLYAEHASRGEAPTPTDIAEVQQRTGWSHLNYDADAIRFARAGMALTFNGIAQGYIADKIAALLRAQGLNQVLIDMGEIRALGRKAKGEPWQVGIATPDNEILRQLPLEDRALATSAPQGTLLDPGNSIGHILDPRSGRPAESWKLVSVSSDRAAVADGLSTAICLLPRATIERVLPTYPRASLELLV